MKYVIALLFLSTMVMADSRIDIGDCASYPLNDQMMCLGRGILAKMKDPAGLTQLNDCRRFTNSNQRLQCVGYAIYLSAGGNGNPPPPQKAVKCMKSVGGKWVIVRTADNTTVGRSFFVEEAACRRAEQTATDKLTCAGDTYFGQQIYLYDIWENIAIGGGQFGQSCFDALEAYKRGKPLICTYDSSADNGWTVTHIEKRIDYFPYLHQVTAQECQKIIATTMNGKFCYKSYGGFQVTWFQYDYNGIKLDTAYSSLDNCVRGL